MADLVLVRPSAASSGTHVIRWDEVPARPVKYVAYAIEDDGKYYYQVGEKILEITEREYEAVRRNPNFYYFSTACKLHYRMGLENKGTRLQDLPRKNVEPYADYCGGLGD